MPRKAFAILVDSRPRVLVNETHSVHKPVSVHLPNHVHEVAELPSGQTLDISPDVQSFARLTNGTGFGEPLLQIDSHVFHFFLGVTNRVVTLAVNALLAFVDRLFGRTNAAKN